MPRRPPTDHFIKERVDVDDASRTMTFGAGRARKGKPFDASAENLYFLGLPGSGRKDVARAVAERLGLEFVDCTGQAAAQGQLDQLAKAVGKAVALGREALENEALRQALGHARVYFLMADVPLLYKRLGGDKSLVEALRRDLNQLEPAYMALARHTLRAEADLDDLVASVEATLPMPL